MKRIIGFAVIATFSITIFLNTSADKSSSNIFLNDLLVANAQDYENGNGASGYFGTAVLHTVCHTVTVGGGPLPGSYSYQDCYDEWQCDGWNGWCY